MNTIIMKITIMKSMTPKMLMFMLLSSSALGFEIADTSPWRNSDQLRRLVVTAASRLTGAERHNPNPSQIRYSPPTTFSAVNQVADAWISAPKPKAQNDNTTAKPSTPPEIVKSVLRRP